MEIFLSFDVLYSDTAGRSSGELDLSLTLLSSHFTTRKFSWTSLTSSPSPWRVFRSAPLSSISASSRHSQAGGSCCSIFCPWRKMSRNLSIFSTQPGPGYLHMPRLAMIVWTDLTDLTDHTSRLSCLENQYWWREISECGTAKLTWTSPSY